MFNNTLKSSLSKLGVTALFLSLGISMVAFNATADTSETKVQTKTMSSDWVRPSDAELKKVLTKLQFDVTRKDKTERPFSNEYWDNKQDGIYVDIISGEPLFSSKHKFKSGTGWPSFTHPLVDSNIVEKDDFSLFGKRIEVRSKNADSHLGHVFNDGPGANGLRYCINSASLRFIPKEKLKAEGYEQYVGTFK